MRLKCSYCLIIVFFMVSCHKVTWFDSKQQAIDQKTNGNVIAQEIILNNYTFIVIASEAVMHEQNVAFMVLELLQQNKKNKFACYTTTEEIFVSIPYGGSIPMKTSGKENFRLMMNMDNHELDKIHKQITAKGVDAVSDIFKFREMYFFIKSGSDIL